MKSVLRIRLFFAFMLAADLCLAQSKPQVLKDWKRAEQYTLHYLQAMPEKDYNFKPAPEMRTFAEHMLHLTDANFELASLAGLVQSPLAPGAAGKSDKSKDSVIKMVTAGYEFVISNINNMTAKDFDDSVTLFSKYRMTRGTLLSKIFEHQTHHRGQTTVYFHLVGVKPPDEELF